MVSSLGVMKHAALLLHLFVIAAAAAAAAEVVDLSRSEFDKSPTFESSSGAETLRSFVEDRPAVLSYMVLENGRAVAEYYNASVIDATAVADVWSVTKSYVGLLVGVMENMDLISVEETLLDIWPDPSEEIWPYVSDAERKKTMTIESLLTMTSGYDDPPRNFSAPVDMKTLGGGNLVDTLSYPVWQGVPSETFLYVGANILSYAIVERTGQTPKEFFAAKVAPFLGMEPGTYEWFENLDGVSMTRSGMRLSLPQMAKFGQLLLQKGAAAATERIVSEDWVGRATSGLIDVPLNDTMRTYMFWGNEMPLNYGYFLWVYPDLDSAYCAVGTGGHYICVYPSQGRVLAVQVLMDAASGYDIVRLVSPLSFDGGATKDEVEGGDDKDASSPSTGLENADMDEGERDDQSAATKSLTFDITALFLLITAPLLPLLT